MREQAATWAAKSGPRRRARKRCPRRASLAIGFVSALIIVDAIMFKFVSGKEESAAPAPESPKSEGRFAGVVNFLDEKIVQRVDQKAQSVVESAQNYQLGLLMLATGAFFVSLSLFFLPFVAVKPYKFCALNCFGTFSLLLSLVFLRGKGVLRALFSRQKVFYTLVFLTSLVAQLYFSVISPSYVFVLLSFGAHFSSCLYLLFSLVPGGVRFLNTVFGTGWSMARAALAGGQASNPVV